MIYDPQRILSTADSFFLAAERSSEQRSLGSGQVQVLVVPAIVCCAFAIELYFKAIITLEGGSTTGHDFGQLYVQMSPGTRTGIQARLSLVEADFDQRLREATDAFVHWRYIFEHQSAHVDPAFLWNLAHAAKVQAVALLARTGSGKS